VRLITWIGSVEINIFSSQQKECGVRTVLRITVGSPFQITSGSTPTAIGSFQSPLHFTRTVQLLINVLLMTLGIGENAKLYAIGTNSPHEEEISG